MKSIHKRRNFVRDLVTEQENAFSRQSQEYAHKQKTLFQEFDGAIKDKDATVQALQQELANHKEHAHVELEQARRDMERVANVRRPVIPARRRLHTKTPPVAQQQRAPSMV